MASSILGAGFAVFNSLSKNIMNRYRNIKVEIPDFEVVKDLVDDDVKNVKPYFDPWFYDKPSRSKLFRLLLFIGNDDPSYKLELGQSNRSFLTLRIWLSCFDNNKWITPSKGALQNWIKLLVVGKVLSYKHENQGVLLQVLEFEKYCYPRESTEVCNEPLQAHFKPTSSPRIQKASGEQEKELQAHYKQPINKLNNLILKEKKEQKKNLDFSVSIKTIIEYLNLKTGSKFKHNSAIAKRQLQARLNEGYNQQDFFDVINFKIKDWAGNIKMQNYLTPQTLFSTKFDIYLNNSKLQDQDKYAIALNSVKTSQGSNNERLLNN